MHLLQRSFCTYGLILLPVVVRGSSLIHAEGLQEKTLSSVFWFSTWSEEKKDNNAQKDCATYMQIKCERMHYSGLLGII